MISNTYLLALPHGSVFSEGWCVVDIETEGRFWRTSKLLKACAVVYGDPCIEYEWIAEKEADEYDILSELSKVLKRTDHLMTFNGNSFDLPHLRKKYQAYRASDPTGGRKSLDLMHELMPYRFLFDLDSYHLKDYLSLFKGAYPVRNEAEGALLASSLLDLARVFEPPAGDLCAYMSVRQPGEISGDEPCGPAGELMSARQFGDISGAESYTSFGSVAANICKGHMAAGCVLTIEWTKDTALPVDIDLTDEVFRLMSHGAKMTLCANNDGTSLRRYYKDYENYDFLLAEGYAAHKSLTAYVASDRKVKAVRENCYSLVPVSSVYPDRLERLKKYAGSVLAYMRRDIP